MMQLVLISFSEYHNMYNATIDGINIMVPGNSIAQLARKCDVLVDININLEHLRMIKELIAEGTYLMDND